VLLARQVGREAAEEIMTTAEMLRREGRIEGKLEGLRVALGAPPREGSACSMSAA
jgi:hypothetical protein